MEAKQVIVMRTDLGMRKGKMIAQGAHASIAFLTNKLRVVGNVVAEDERLGKLYGGVFLAPAEVEWVDGRFTKVCVRVDSEEELIGIHQNAEAIGLTSYLITDAGLTEFGGVPTITCCAIGPDWSDAIDSVTGDLKLL